MTITRNIHRAAAFLLAGAMTVLLVSQAATPAYADSASDKRAELQAQIKEQQETIDSINEQLAQVTSDRQEAESTKALYEQKKTELENQMSVIIQKKNDTENAIVEKEDEIAAKQAEVDQKQAEYDAQWAEFKEQMASMQRLNDGGAVAMLANVTSLYQLLTFSHTLGELSSKNEEMCNTLEAQREELDAEKQTLEQQKSDLEAQQAQLADDQAELDSTIGEYQSTIQQQSSTIDAAQAEEEALQAAEAEARKLMDQASAELDQLLAQQVSNAALSEPIYLSSLNFICPLDSYKRITCNFGANGHKGVDISAAGGTPIRAVAAGTVTTAAYHSSYGNYVQIYHGTDDSGNTYATLYAHMVSAPIVSAGQSVEQGQIIGYVGSTGNSTGNHLHLEMRVNGTRVNALTYVPIG